MTARSVAALRLLLLIVWGMTALTGPAAAAGDFIWLEGEAPSSVTPTGYKPEITDVGAPQYLSGGKWLHVNVGHDDVAKTAPDGITLSYQFTTPKAATYEIWDRAGFQASRSEFDWRLDGGDWHSVLPGAPFTQVQQLQTWNDVSWMHLGNQNLNAGAHTFEFRIPKTTDSSGKTHDMQFACDALCFSAGPFIPNDKYKPDDTGWQTDADKAAAQKVFDVPAPTGAAQTATPLNGDWQMARDEEETIHDVDGPIPSVAGEDMLAWKAMAVPGGRDGTHPEWLYAHRYLLRTRVNIPASPAERSFVLHFPALNMLATVFVNGQPCGFDNTPLAAWDCDVTKAVRPGQTNEVVVGIKDWYYALPDLGAKEGGVLRYVPTDWVTRFGPASFTYPIWNHEDSSILRTPSLIVGGAAYTSDVFCKPSVSSKTLGLEITINNPSSRDRTVSIGNAVAPLAGGPVEKTFPAQPVTVPAGGSKTVQISENWNNPKLWWPDDPNQYVVTTTLSEGGQAIDARTTKFGFREWTWAGDDFTLNGIPWHGRADTSALSQTLDDTWLKAYHAHGQDMVRVWGEGANTDHDLDWYDAHGVNVRRTAIFDGEAARYHLDTPGLWDHYRTQLAAWIKGQRNHPSIFIWSVENEITFINGHVTGQDQLTTYQHHKTAQAVDAVDSTRPFMVDGGNALLDESFPVYGGHYMEPSFQSLPEGAYNDRMVFAHRQVWPVTKHKPILLGEAFYANGNEAADFATVGGEAAFVGKSEARPAIGLVGKMLSEGYRWNGVNFHFWEGDTSDLYYNSWQPVAVLCRQWDSTFGSGQRVLRTLGIFNDTHDASPITLTWSLAIAGKTVEHQTAIHHVAPGMSETFAVALPMPHVASRQEGQWILTLSHGSKSIFTDVKPISVLNTSAGSAAVSEASRDCPTPERMAVYDPDGSVVAFLRTHGLVFTRILSFTGASKDAKVLIIGPDALTPAQSASSALAAYAAGGRTVIILEQKNPLKYQGLPDEMATTTDQGDIAFAEDLENPVLKGLQQKDFFTWGTDGLVYKNAYSKPASGGRSLVQCDDRLQDTALVQMPAGKGLLLLSQLVVGRKLAVNPVAQRLLLNMISYGALYRQTFHPVAVAADNPPLIKALDAAGLQYSKAAEPLTAISKPGGIAVISATPANLHTLAASMTRVNAFTQSGGWIIFNNLTPDGLQDYNKIVGYDHIIRPYHQEKVTWPTVRSPLTAGLPTSNIVMGSGQQIFNWAAGQYPDTDAYSYVVDIDEVAPFAQSSFFAYDKITNNYTMADGYWPLIINFPAPADGKPFSIPITLPRPETITRFTFVGDNNYMPQTKVNLVFNGTDTVAFDYNHGDPSKPAAPQTYAINPPRTAQNITLQITGWDQPAGSTGGNIGVDNIYLYAKRPADFAQNVRPMLNIGAMVEYPKGAGGIILCNVKFKDSEANPENMGKKETIIVTLLKNLNAPFSGGKTLIAGANNLTYAPLDISKQADQYKNDQGWFGDKQFTFADLPGGKQIYAGVPYNVYSFATSPVPTVIMLGGNGIPGNLPDHVSDIAVNRKADALFFLQAARIDQRRSPDDIKNKRQFEIADYVVHYADGQTAKIPIYSEVNVDNYQQETPAPVPGAQIAWVKPYAGTKFSAVAYSMQWNNPRPDAAIQSVDLISGPNRDHGDPALLAVTAATAE